MALLCLPAKSSMASRKRFRVPSIAEMEMENNNQLRNKRGVAAEEPTASCSGVTPPVQPKTFGCVGGLQRSVDAKQSALIECLSKFRETARHAKIVEELKTVKPIAPPRNAISDQCPASITSSSLIINNKQKGNPLIQFLRNVRLEYCSIIPDFIMGKTTCAVFLSLRYHNLYPNYIHDRLKMLGRQYELRILLVQVDVKDCHHSLKVLTKIAILADCTLLLAWSPEEAAKYIETYKVFENKPADILMKKQESDSYSKVLDALSSIKSINKSDAGNLLSTFGTLAKICKANKEDFEVCPGMGPKKVNDLYLTLHEPFLKSDS